MKENNFIVFATSQNGSLVLAQHSGGWPGGHSVGVRAFGAQLQQGPVAVLAQIAYRQEHKYVNAFTKLETNSSTSFCNCLFHTILRNIEANGTFS